jgi:Domain of unknown function (DUF3416)
LDADRFERDPTVHTAECARRGFAVEHRDPPIPETVPPKVPRRLATALSPGRAGAIGAMTSSSPWEWRGHYGVYRGRDEAVNETGQQGATRGGPPYNATQLRAKRTRWVVVGRIEIDDVEPVGPGGRYPAKAVVGEVVPIEDVVSPAAWVKPQLITMSPGRTPEVFHGQFVPDSVVCGRSGWMAGAIRSPRGSGSPQARRGAG